MHHTTLKAAVKKYAELHANGRPEADVKSEIALDEKGYNLDEINEIYGAIVEAHQAEVEEAETDSKKSKKERFTVKSSFRDIDDFNTTWNEGDDVSHFDKDRLQRLVDAGHVEKK